MLLSDVMVRSKAMLLSILMTHSMNVFLSFFMVRSIRLLLSAIMARSKDMLLSTYDDSLDTYVSVSIAGFALKICFYLPKWLTINSCFCLKGWFAVLTDCLVLQSYVHGLTALWQMALAASLLCPAHTKLQKGGKGKFSLSIAMLWL